MRDFRAGPFDQMTVGWFGLIRHRPNTELSSKTAFTGDRVGFGDVLGWATVGLVQHVSPASQP
jgi:hypothetical protein